MAECGHLVGLLGLDHGGSCVSGRRRLEHAETRSDPADRISTTEGSDPSHV